MVYVKIGCEFCKRNPAFIAKVRESAKTAMPVLKCPHDIGLYYRFEAGQTVSYVTPQGGDRRQN